MKLAAPLKNFHHFFRHECHPSNFHGWLGRRKGEYTCPVCRAKWKTSGNNGWKHAADGTEGQILAVIVGYPDGSRQTFFGDES